MRTMIQRYTAKERSNHWVVAIAFVLAALSGLALFHPAFFFLTNLFGGGTWNRILHPFIGVVMFLSFTAMATRFWRFNHFTPADRQWMKRIKDVLCNRDQGLPELGKYNAGQKTLFWVMVVSIPALLLSGIVIWQPWFAPYFPIWLQECGRHALTGPCDELAGITCRSSRDTRHGGGVWPRPRKPCRASSP